MAIHHMFFKDENRRQNADKQRFSLYAELSSIYMLFRTDVGAMPISKLLWSWLLISPIEPNSHTIYRTSGRCDDLSEYSIVHSIYEQHLHIFRA